MQSRTVVAAITAALVLTVAGGCGSSGPLTRAQLTQRANVICKQRTTHGAAMRKQYAGDLRRLAAAMLPRYSRSVHDLHGLKPQGDVKAPYGRFLEVQDFYLAQLKRAATGHVAGENVARTHEMMAAVQQLGLTACGF